MQPLSDPSWAHWPLYHWPLSILASFRSKSHTIKTCWAKGYEPCMVASTHTLFGLRERLRSCVVVQVQYQGWSFMRFHCRWLGGLVQVLYLAHGICQPFLQKAILRLLPEENVLWFASQKVLRRRWFHWRAILPVITDLIEIPIHIPRILRK